MDDNRERRKEIEAGVSSEEGSPDMGIATGEGLGTIRCDNSVFKEIAAHAALQVEGIAGIGGRSTLGDWLLLLREKGSGVEVHTAQDDPQLTSTQVGITLTVNIYFGYNIYDVCTELQRRIKNEIETITSYNVRCVNINVQGLKPREQVKSEKEEPIIAPEM
ncbi:MAG: Asp23/Gls24 family envelope stress response protein [Candidatus Sumerlaeota bacterium]|nr:Asp23/Gls24 family envelope stress response protein [Candidatus Sumerlaeota bacterium]